MNKDTSEQKINDAKLDKLEGYLKRVSDTTPKYSVTASNIVRKANEGNSRPSPYTYTRSSFHMSSTTKTAFASVFCLVLVFGGYFLLRPSEQTSNDLANAKQASVSEERVMADGATMSFAVSETDALTVSSNNDADNLTDTIFSDTDAEVLEAQAVIDTYESDTSLDELDEIGTINI